MPSTYRLRLPLFISHKTFIQQRNTELIASGKTNKPIMVPLIAGEGKVYTVKWDNLSLNVEMSGDTYYMIKKTDFGWRCFCEHL